MVLLRGNVARSNFQDPGAICKLEATSKRLPHTFCNFTGHFSHTNTTNLQNLVKLLKCKSDSPSLAEFISNWHLNSSSHWELCGPNGDQRQNEIHGAHTLLNFLNRALLPASLITLTWASVHAASWAVSAFSQVQQHFLTCTIIRTIH